MRLFPAALLATFALCACSKQEFASAGKQSPVSLAQSASPAAAGAAGASRKATGEARIRYLAYEHSVQLDTDAAKVAPAYDAIQAACAAAEGCVVLRASLAGGRMPGAGLQLRAAPAGIRRLTALLGTQGEIASQQMSAEDLGGPIEDGERKLAMLKDYRTRLEELRGRAANTIDTLIRVNQELAQVQSQIEAQSGASAHLHQRVDTELLNIQISARDQASAWRPTLDALGSFGANLAAGIAAALVTLAYALPFGVLLLVPLWGLRRLWRRRRQKA
ncbi:MAG TPA: DUF4349 domain-containing protein [Burkholderiales bacterium]